VRRLAVLGAAGFIGARAVEMIHLSGAAQVRAVVRRPARGALAARCGAEIAVADALRRAELARAFAGCDAVLAATAGDPASIVGAVGPIYRACADVGVRRLIYLSSAAVHGQAPPPGVDEDTPLSTAQPLAYNSAKVRAELALRALAADRRVDVVILRPGIVYGPRSQWVGGWADEVLSGEAYVVGAAAGVLNGIYVDNLVHGVALAWACEAARGRTYLLADREQVTWRDLLAPITETLGAPWDEIPDLDPAKAEPEIRSRLDQVRAWPPARAAARLAPVALKTGVRAALSVARGRGAGPTDAGGPGARRPSLERALLHTARHRPTCARARRELGFEPPVSFAEGLGRSLAWLGFAGYPSCGG
jgi:nucleoside-diphosphate-sugar epimerase